MRFITVASVLLAAASRVLAHDGDHGGDHECSSSQFKWTFANTGVSICLSHGFKGIGQCPSDKECPSGWVWNDNYQSCVPQHPNPGNPSCSHGDWDHGDQCCHKPHPTTTTQPAPTYRWGSHRGDRGDGEAPVLKQEDCSATESVSSQAFLDMVCSNPRLPGTNWPSIFLSIMSFIYFSSVSYKLTPFFLV
ncbi:uncharacterized protein EI90DRAFT_2506743 [Cantharellus anzutake]|uniref:uncharacterized protein n=1 Tax=Cantharellus anzutake TaxID=1750568 RepID=UPI0019074837|nr:uncharacterized protein EI90DRAFT_2506743 [Cantharellus anzutake]KAF8321386.1 hypothetical protein EI90DRAFT_2506743 [Cantharellus anzutake]